MPCGGLSARPDRLKPVRRDNFTEAADEAGMATRYPGIHFRRAHLAGRELGRAVADLAWAKASSYFNGSAPALPFESLQAAPH